MSSIGNQLKKLKENWLLIGLVLLVLLVVMGGPISLFNTASFSSNKIGGFGMESAAYDVVGRSSGISAPYPGGGFAPEVTERKITKSGTLTSEAAQGAFDDKISQIKTVSKNAGAIILYENIQDSQEANEGYQSKTSYLSVRVPSNAYDNLVVQLKGIATVKSYSESLNDITGSYTTTEDQLKAEKARLAIFKALRDQSNTEMKERIQLTDRIFDIERTISYYERSISDQDQQIDYSTLSITLTEKSSPFASLIFSKPSELVRNFLGSLNSVFVFVSYILPWAIGGGLIWLIISFLNARKT